jgi:hypothetical protein
MTVLIVKSNTHELDYLFKFASLFLLSFLSFAFLFCVSYFSLAKRSCSNVFKFLGTYPLFISVLMGLSLHNSIAVFEGYIGKRTPFVGTPKFNIKSKADK